MKENVAFNLRTNSNDNVCNVIIYLKKQNIKLRRENYTDIPRVACSGLEKYVNLSQMITSSKIYIFSHNQCIFPSSAVSSLAYVRVFYSIYIARRIAK